MGGGFEIALACDIIIAAESAPFALPEPRVGLAAVAGAVHRLPRAIGTKQAMTMILTGRHVTAQEGKDLGFVAEVVPDGQALDAARRWAALILECSPMSIRASKQAVMASFEHTGDDAAAEGWGLDFAVGDQHSAKYSALQAMMRSEDVIEGPKAFAEKRPPQWKGR